MKSVRLLPVLLRFLFATVDGLGRLRLLQQRQPSLPLLDQLHATVGHKQHQEGGQGEAWKKRTQRGREEAEAWLRWRNKRGKTGA